MGRRDRGGSGVKKQKYKISETTEYVNISAVFHQDTQFLAVPYCTLTFSKALARKRGDRSTEVEEKRKGRYGSEGEDRPLTSSPLSGSKAESREEIQFSLKAICGWETQCMHDIPIFLSGW